MVWWHSLLCHCMHAHRPQTRSKRDLETGMNAETRTFLNSVFATIALFRVEFLTVSFGGRVRDSPFALHLLNHITQLLEPLLEHVGVRNWSVYFTLGYQVNAMNVAFESVPTRKMGMDVVQRLSLAQSTLSRVSFLCGARLCFLFQSV